MCLGPRVRSAPTGRVIVYACDVLLLKLFCHCLFSLASSDYKLFTDLRKRKHAVSVSWA